MKSQQKRIELVTRPVHDQTPHLRENEACPVGDLVAEDVLELLVRAESELFLSEQQQSDAAVLLNSPS